MNGFCQRVKQGTPVSLVIVPEVQIMPSLLQTNWGLDWIHWGEGEEWEEGIMGTEGEIVSKDRSVKMCRPSCMVPWLR